MVTVSSLIDELEDAHREPMGTAEKQAWVEVGRLTALAKTLEAERDQARRAFDLLNRGSADATFALLDERNTAIAERDAARADADELRRALDRIRDQVAEMLVLAGCEADRD